MIGTPAIRNLIREDKVAQMYSAIQTGANIGMQTLDQCLQNLLSKGYINRDTAREKAKKNPRKRPAMAPARPSDAKATSPRAETR